MQDLYALQTSVQTRLNESLTIPSVNKSPQYSRSSLKEREKGVYKIKEREKGVQKIKERENGVYKIKERERDVNKVKEREKGVSLYRNSLLSQPMDVNYSHLYPSLSSSYIDHHRVEEVPNHHHHHPSIPAMKDDDYIEPYDRVARSYSSVTNSLQDPINLSQSIELPPSGKGSRPDVAIEFGSFRPGVASEFGSFRPTLQSTGNNARGNSPDYNSKIINSIQPPTTSSSSGSSSIRYGLINNPHSTSFKSNVTSTTLSPPAVFSINKPPQSIPIHAQVQSLHPNSNTINNNNITTTTIPNSIANSSPNSLSALPIAVASLTTLKNTANKSTSSSALSIKKSSLGGSKPLPRKSTISNNNYKGNNINKGSPSGINTTSNQTTKRSPTFITALTTTSSVDDNMMMSDEEERRSSSVSPDSINDRRMKNKVESSSDISISSDNE